MPVAPPSPTRHCLPPLLGRGSVTWESQTASVQGRLWRWALVQVTAGPGHWLPSVRRTVPGTAPCGRETVLPVLSAPGQEGVLRPAHGPYHRLTNSTVNQGLCEGKKCVCPLVGNFSLGPGKGRPVEQECCRERNKIRCYGPWAAVGLAGGAPLCLSRVQLRDSGAPVQNQRLA